MNKNATAILLIVLAIGIYFTFTSGRVKELKSIQDVNAQYEAAIDNALNLVKIRDNVLKSYNSISETDRDRLNKIVPDNVDNVRLIIDVKDDIAARHGLFLKNIKTASPDAPVQNTGPTVPTPVLDSSGVANGGIPSPGDSTGNQYGVVTLSFTVTSSYDNFVAFLKDLEASLRIMDISKLTVAQGTDKSGAQVYDFGVEMKTYWLKNSK